VPDEGPACPPDVVGAAPNTPEPVEIGVNPGGHGKLAAPLEKPCVSEADCPD